MKVEWSRRPFDSRLTRCQVTYADTQARRRTGRNDTLYQVNVMSLGQ